jgi:nitrite reductase (NADH) large subunit
MRLLLIGAGMATSRLLSELVAHDCKHDITVVSAETTACYNRILLSSILAGDKSLQDVALLEEGWLEQHGITLLCGERVERIKLERKQVVTSKLRLLNYDALVFATGSEPFVPPIPGVDADNVMSFRNLDDLEKIASHARPGARSVVIGGGLLGLEAAYGLNSLGAKPVVVNREDWLMPRQLSQAAATILQFRLEQLGMDFRLGTTPKTIQHLEGQARSVILENGERLPADLVLVTAGITPNCTLARQAGLDCDRGILIDSRMATSCPDVYALGECAQLDKQLFGLVAPVYQQAAVLAAGLMGVAGPGFSFSEAPTQLKISGIDVVSAGLFENPLPEGIHEQVLCDPQQGVYRRLVFKDASLLGYELVGDRLHGAAYARLLGQSGAVAAQDRLMFDSTPGEQSESEAVLLEV